MVWSGFDDTNKKGRSRLLVAGAAALVVLHGEADAEGWSVRAAASAGKQIDLINAEGGDRQDPFYNVSGAVMYSTREGFYVQGSLEYERLFNMRDDGPQDLTMTGIHVGFRRAGSWSVGGLVAAVRGNIVDRTDTFIDTGTLVAGEVTWQRPGFSIHGQLGGGEIDVDPSSGEGFIDGTFWRLMARLYPSERLLVEFDYTSAYSRDYTDGHDGTWNTFEARLFRQLSGPWSAYLGWRTANYFVDDDDEAHLAEDSFFVGVSYQAGGSPRAFDREGASFTLPFAVARGAGYTEAVDRW